MEPKICLKSYLNKFGPIEQFQTSLVNQFWLVWTNLNISKFEKFQTSFEKFMQICKMLLYFHKMD